MRRLLTILAAGSLILATAACSGDDDKDNDDTSPTTAPSVDPKEQKKRVAKTTKCTVEASSTGAYQGEWSGEASVRTGGKPADDTGPKAVYSAANEKSTLALYSPGSAFKGSVTLAVGKKIAYSSDPAKAESLDIDEKGKSAQVDVTLTSIEGDTVDLVAEFACGKAKKKQ